MIKNYFYLSHPIAVLLYFGGAIGFSMAASGPILSAVSLVCALICCCVACGRRVLPAAFRTALPTVLILTCVNPLLNARGLTVLFSVGGHMVTVESLLYGFSSGMMLAAVMVWFLLLNEMAGNDALLTVFSGFLPMLGLTVCMILRYIPRYIKSARDAQAVYRVICGEEYGIRSRVRGLLRVSTVVLEKSLEDSVETAKSMTARGYGKGRKKISMPPFSRSDKISFGLLCALLCCGTVLLLLCGRFVFFPAPSLPSLTGVTALCLTVFFLFPVILEGKDRIKWLVFR